MTAAAKTYTDAERVELQRKTTAEHLALENAHKMDEVLKTFAADGVFYDIVPGAVHIDGMEGVTGFYEMLFSVFPDIAIKITHSYDVPGCCVREGVVTGTHSAEFAGVPASGNFISFPFCAMYIYADDPTKLLAERAYWDNDGIIKQMRGEEIANPDVPWDGTR